MNYHIQTKSRQRDNKQKNNDNEQSSECTETDEDDDSDQEPDADIRLISHRTVPNEVPLGKNIPESKTRQIDTIAADKECERVVANWIEHKVK